MKAYTATRDHGKGGSGSGLDENHADTKGKKNRALCPEALVKIILLGTLIDFLFRLRWLSAEYEHSVLVRSVYVRFCCGHHDFDFVLVLPSRDHT